jgi:membrane protein YqaA with SNARE-associated domain
MTDTTAIQTAPETKNGNGRDLSGLLITIGLIATGLIIIGLFKDEINAFGVDLLNRYGQGWVDVVLFLLTAVSSTPLVLPIWGYAQAGVAIGYSIVHLAIVMAVGSATGSLVTYYLGRVLGDTRFVQRKFPNLRTNRWTEGRSKRMVTLFLFLGTASPIPSDVLYAACGFKRFPVFLFYVTMVAARFVRYSYLAYFFKYLIDKF